VEWVCTLCSVQKSATRVLLAITALKQVKSPENVILDPCPLECNPCACHVRMDITVRLESALTHSQQPFAQKVCTAPIQQILKSWRLFVPLANTMMKKEKVLQGIAKIVLQVISAPLALHKSTSALQDITAQLMQQSLLHALLTLITTFINRQQQPLA